MAKKQFKAESKRLLDLMINSIYTHKEIFLREMISNASDAIDKLCYISLTDDKVGLDRGDFRIKVTADKDGRVLTVSDNGVGMTKEELESNLGTIARSGSLEFKSGMDEDKGGELDIIGQFGVGFYSAFMVSDWVRVVSRAYGAEGGYCWESAGADGYTVKPCDKDAAGTDIIMRIKADTEDENYSDFLETWRLRELVKKYSDYVRWPIIMDVEKAESKDTGILDKDGKPVMESVTVISEETVNSMVPIWQRAKSEVSDEDCENFYKETYFDYGGVARVIRVNAEGSAVSYKAMLFVPEKAPYDFYSRDFKPGLSLYSSGVMIMDRCADLLPDCFRFVRGVVDSPDLSLNISRETLQHDRQLKVIASSLEKKIKSELLKLMDEDRDKYVSFFESFGLQLKYGVVSDYGSRKDFLVDLLMFRSSSEKNLIPLREYAKKMPEEQQYIYYACADTVKLAESTPAAEMVRDKGFDMLCLTQEVDEFAAQAIAEFEGKKLVNVNSDDLGLTSDEEKEQTKEKEAEVRELLDFVKETLGDAVSEVKLSEKLKTHPVCLTTAGGVTLEMEKYFNSIPGAEKDRIKAQRVLELNGDHAAFAALKTAYETDKERAKKLAGILHAQALLTAGLPIEDPAAYTELVCGLF